MYAYTKVYDNLHSFNIWKMLPSNSITIHSNSKQSEKQLGQGGSGTVFRYKSSRYDAPVARKMLTSRSMYTEEVRYLRLCAARSFETLSKYIIKCVGHCTLSDHSWLIDFELAKTDFHDIAVDHNRRGTGCKEFFPDAYSIDRAVIDTLSGLAFLHESVNIAHNDIKPANLLMVINADKSQTAKIGDLGLCTELHMGKQVCSLGYSAPELYDKCFYGNQPPHPTFAILGKSDLFGLGLAFLFVTEGERPYPIPIDFGKAFQKYCDAGLHGANSQALLQPLCVIATRFYHQFSPKLPVGRNINEVSFAAKHTIAAMCQPKMCDRPTAQECLDLFYKLDLIAHPRQPTPVFNVSVQAASNSSTAVSVMSVSVQAVSSSIPAVSNSVQTSLKSRLDISQIRQTADVNRIHDVNFTTAVGDMGDFGIVPPATVLPTLQENMEIVDTQTDDDINDEGGKTISASTLRDESTGSLPGVETQVTHVAVGNSNHDANEVHNSVSNSDAHTIHNANEVRQITSNANSNANSVADKSRVSDALPSYANVSDTSTGSLYQALAGFSFFNQPPDDHALGLAMDYAATNTNVDAANALPPLSGAHANVQQHIEVAGNVEPMVTMLDPEVDALNALLDVAANIHRASFLGESLAIREYLTNHNMTDQLNLLNLLQANHIRGKMTTLAVKLLRMLNNQNHPLYGSRKRMFLVLTGYTLNWYRKSQFVKQTQDHLY